MSKKFVVCKENELKNVVKTENKKHRNPPKIYMAGYTKFSSWVYEDWSPDSDYIHENFFFVDYSDDGEDAVWDKFFEHKVYEIFNEREYERITVDREDYSIDICYNEFETCSLSAFWHSAEMSEEEIEWVRGD